MNRTYSSFPFCAACVLLLSFAINAHAQNTLTFDKINLMANGHIMTIQPPTLSGNDTFNFPSAPAGITPGYVEQGDITKPFLQWDGTNNYWKAVTSSFGSGVANRLTRWGTSSSLDTSILYDDGSCVAINTTMPTSNVSLQVNGTVFFGGETGLNPDTNGTLMMWLGEKGAVRAGYIDGTQWDDANTGINSVAMGHNARASGDYSIALGDSIAAAHIGSVCIGHGLNALGYRSTAMGSFASTNYKQGSFVYGDNSTGTFVNNTATQQFMVRATGGFVFYTSLNGSPADQNSWIGAALAAGATSWSVISDSNRKENRLRANGEEVLGKISNMWLGSWNYKGQDPKQFRHYGPMAQEFYAAFGHDGIGTSGNDTTITSGDFDGVNMIAIQALEKRTAAQDTRIQQLEAENIALRNELQAMKQAITTIAKVQQQQIIMKEARIKEASLR